MNVNGNNQFNGRFSISSLQKQNSKGYQIYFGMLLSGAGGGIRTHECLSQRILSPPPYLRLFSGLTVKVINDCHGLTVLADSFLRQLFYNFVDNTIKYGKKTTAIRVYYKKAEAGELRLIYEDDGVGISAENKLKLFKEGFSTGGSTGFGLFLIRKMMDVYGWQIQETGEPGEGAKFTITIPKLNKNGKENFQITR